MSLSASVPVSFIPCPSSIEGLKKKKKVNSICTTKELENETKVVNIIYTYILQVNFMVCQTRSDQVKVIED